MDSQFEALMKNPEFRREFTIEKFVTDCTQVLADAMQDRQITKSDLARRLGKSRAWVTQLLQGGRNTTARTLAEVAYALGVELGLSVADLAVRPEVNAGRQSAKFQDARRSVLEESAGRGAVLKVPRSRFPHSHRPSPSYSRLRQDESLRDLESSRLARTRLGRS